MCPTQPPMCRAVLEGGCGDALGRQTPSAPPPPLGLLSHQHQARRGLSLACFIYLGPRTMKPGSERRMERPFPIFPPGLLMPLSCPSVPREERAEGHGWKTMV